MKTTEKDNYCPAMVWGATKANNRKVNCLKENTALSQQ